jgi:hypothetical protein
MFSDVMFACRRNSNGLTASAWRVDLLLLNTTMSDGKLEKMEKDFSPQVDLLLPETERLQQV